MWRSPSFRDVATVTAGIPRIVLRVASDASPSSRTKETASAPFVVLRRRRAVKTKPPGNSSPPAVFLALRAN